MSRFESSIQLYLRIAGCASFEWFGCTSHACPEGQRCITAAIISWTVSAFVVQFAMRHRCLEVALLVEDVVGCHDVVRFLHLRRERSVSWISQSRISNQNRSKWATSSGRVRHIYIWRNGIHHTSFDPQTRSCLGPRSSPVYPYLYRAILDHIDHGQEQSRIWYQRVIALHCDERNVLTFWECPVIQDWYVVDRMNMD